MKPVEELTVFEIFDRLATVIYYGAMMRNQLRDNKTALTHAQNLLAELRQDSFLLEKMES